jgi:hypothetical protein
LSQLAQRCRRGPRRRLGCSMRRGIVRQCSLKRRRIRQRAKSSLSKTNAEQNFRPIPAGLKRFRFTCDISGVGQFSGGIATRAIDPRPEPKTLQRHEANGSATAHRS